jgi:hypothetical protein
MEAPRPKRRKQRQQPYQRVPLYAPPATPESIGDLEDLLMLIADYNQPNPTKPQYQLVVKLLTILIDDYQDDPTQHHYEPLVFPDSLCESPN